MEARSLPAFLEPNFLRRLERLRLVAKKLAWSSLKGEHPSPKKGFSLEFSDYRNYQRGDDLRYVDWNVYRRLEKLFLKLSTAEEEMNVYFLLDTSLSMTEGNPAKMDYAKTIAAALGYVGLKNLDRVGGAAFSTEDLSSLPLGRGKRQILALFNFLSGLACKGATDLQAAARSFAVTFPRPGLVVVLSDLFDPAGWRAGLEELAKKRHQLLVIHVLDENEGRPEAWGDVALVEAESARERKLFVDADLVRRFQSEFESYVEEIRAFCFSRQIDYLRTTTATPFEEFVLSSLRQVRSIRSRF
ncbi:MAG: DUF58 domain-containing protein [Deltaproteobacteria bacterium]|nr:DUF58 domain-containing protein [Deltaproteobacteria bacterium]